MTKLEQLLISRRRILQGAAALTAGSLIGRQAYASPEKPLTMIGWMYQPQIVEANLEIFRKLYDENITYELVTGDYHPIAETKLTGGQHVDMLYSEEDYIARWHAAGWVRTLDDLQGMAEIKSGMIPVSIDSLSLPDGRICGMPYYLCYNAFLYDEEHLKRAKLEVPNSWPELVESCRKLKADKIADAPYHASWGQQWPAMSPSIFAAWYSEGAKVFDSENNFVDEPALRTVLEAHQTLFREGLVSQDIMTLPGDGVPSYAAGGHTFMVTHDYNHKLINDPGVSKIAGRVRNALMPGATHSTLAWTGGYLMGNEPVDLDRAWNLLQFFGGKSKDGQYHVTKRWALEFGLGSAHKELMADPEIVESFSKWRDVNISTKQLEIATSRKIGKAIWYPEWSLFMVQRLQEYVRTDMATDKLVGELASKATDLKAQYN